MDFGGQVRFSFQGDLSRWGGPNAIELNVSRCYRRKRYAGGCGASPAGTRYILLAPIVEGPFGNPGHLADLADRRSFLSLLQNVGHLRLAELRGLHRRPPVPALTSQLEFSSFRWSRSRGEEHVLSAKGALTTNEA